MASTALELPLFAEPMRSSLAPAECPYDYPAIDEHGGQLLRVLGPPRYSSWHAEYSVLTDVRPCPFCEKAVGDDHTKRGVAIMPDGDMRWCHALCRTEAAKRAMPSMATAKTTRNLPSCSVCGQEYEGHIRPLTNIWDAYGHDGHYYRPSEPFRSMNWPHRTIVDSPYYTADGEIAYAEEAA